jgi:hypothetical protein
VLAVLVVAFRVVRWTLRALAVLVLGVLLVLAAAWVIMGRAYDRRRRHA